MFSPCRAGVCTPGKLLMPAALPPDGAWQGSAACMFVSLKQADNKFLFYKGPLPLRDVALTMAKAFIKMQLVASQNKNQK